MSWDELLDAYPGAVAVIDRRGGVRQTNRAMRGLLDGPWSPLPHRDDQGCLVCRDDCGGLCRAIAAWLDDGATGRFRQRIMDPTSGRILEWRVMLLAGREELLVHVVDVTDTHEDELLQGLLQEAVAQAPDLIGIADGEGTLCWSNEAAVRMIAGQGFADRPLRSLKVCDIQPLVGGVPVREALAQARRGRPFSGESAIIAEGDDEPMAWVSQVVIRHHDPVTGRDYFSTFCRDITPARRAELALKESNARLEALLASRSRELTYSREFLRSLIENNKDLILSVDADNRITFANDGFIEPGAVRELVGMSVCQLVGEEYRQQFCDVCEAVAGGSKAHTRVEAAGAGPLAGRWCLFSVGALRTESGVQGLTLIVSDLSDLRVASERIKSSDKLVATGRMAARIAHEINNPLAGISGALQLVKSDVGPDSPSYQYLVMVDREIARISNIVRQMYGLYRPEQEVARVLDLVPVIGEIAVLMATEAAARGVAVEVRPGPPQLARVHEQNLRQVLLNLVRNAIEATPPGGRISLHVERHGTCVDVIVTDQGPGISADLRGRIFEPFYTSKDSSQGRGLGLGLSISDTLVKVMGGSIDFENVPEGGCRCKVCLPEGGNVDDVP